MIGDSAGGNLAALCLGLRDDGLIHGCLRTRGQVAEVDRLYGYLLGYLDGERLTQVQVLKDMLIAQFGFIVPDGKIKDVPPGMNPTPYGARNADLVPADQTLRPARSGRR